MRSRSRLLATVFAAVAATVTGLVAPGVWAETHPAYPVT